MMPTAYSSAFKAPIVDPYLAQHGSQGKRKPKSVDPTQAAAWGRQVGHLYEAVMASYRLGFHQSVITQALYQVISDQNLQGLLPTVSFLAQTEKELLTTSAQAASHAVALMRTMALGPLCYAQPVKAALAAIPFTGEMLFGPSLPTALQSETDKAKQSQAEDTLLYEKPTVLQRAYPQKVEPAKPAAKQQGPPRQRQGPKRPFTGQKGPQPSKAQKPNKSRTPKASGPKSQV